MRIKDFEKLIKEKKPREIIAMHIESKIYLTNKQIDKLFELRGENYWRWKKRN